MPSEVPAAFVEPPPRREEVAAVAVPAGLQTRFVELFGDEGPSSSPGVVGASMSLDVLPPNCPPAQARVERQSATPVPDGSLANGMVRRRQMPGLIPISQLSSTEGQQHCETVVAAAVVPQGSIGCVASTSALATGSPGSRSMSSATTPGRVRMIPDLTRIWSQRRQDP